MPATPVFNSKQKIGKECGGKLITDALSLFWNRKVKLHASAERSALGAVNELCLRGGMSGRQSCVQAALGCVGGRRVHV